MGLGLVEDVSLLGPSVQRVDVEPGAAWPYVPRHTGCRAVGLVVGRPGGRTSKQHRIARVRRDRLRLVSTVDHVPAIGQRSEVESIRVVDDEEDLGFHAQQGVAAGLRDTRAEPLARCSVARCVDPVHFDRVTGLHAAVGTRGRRKLGLAKVRRLVAGEAAVIGVADEDTESRPLVLGVGVRVDIAEVHLAGRRGQRERLGVQAGCAADVAGRLRPHVDAQLGGRRLRRDRGCIRLGRVRFRPTLRAARSGQQGKRKCQVFHEDGLLLCGESDSLSALVCHTSPTAGRVCASIVKHTGVC